MRRSQNHDLARMLGRVVLAYAAVFAIWLLVAPVYHLLLARTAGVLIPIVSNAHVQKVWIEDNDEEGVGAHFRIRFEGKDPAHTQYSSQTIGLTTDTVVDIRQFGYPIVTFLALALGVSGLRDRFHWKRILVGCAMVFAIFSTWVLVEVYQYAAATDVVFLRENAIARLIPPALYQRNRVPLVTYLGQVIPICVFGVLFVGQLLRFRSSTAEAQGQSRH